MGRHSAAPTGPPHLGAPLPSIDSAFGAEPHSASDDGEHTQPIPLVAAAPRRGHAVPDIDRAHPTDLRGHDEPGEAHRMDPRPVGLRRAERRRADPRRADLRANILDTLSTAGDRPPGRTHAIHAIPGLSPDDARANEQSASDDWLSRSWWSGADQGVGAHNEPGPGERPRTVFDLGALDSLGELGELDRERIPEQRRPLLSSGPLPTVPPLPAPDAAFETLTGGPTASAPPHPSSSPPGHDTPAAEPAPTPWSPTFVGPMATPWSTLPQPAVRPRPLPLHKRTPRPDQPAAPPEPGAQPRSGAAEPPAEPAEPRLLAGWLATNTPADLEDHLRRYGALPRARFAGRRGAAELLALVEQSGLRGRGGAGFPLSRKMAAVGAAASSRRRPVVVANGCESDPTSTKDRLLLHSAPHLVLDGLALAAHAVGADQAIVCVPRGSGLVEPLEDAVIRRTDDPAQVHLVTTPHRFVASEASALVNFLTTGDARPTSAPLPAERGVQGRPTLVDNVETLAHLALLARNDAAWFRARGTSDSPGTMLFTVEGAVAHPGVYEVDMGASAGHLLALAGGPNGPARAALLGGLGGTWLGLPACTDLSLAHRRPDRSGPALGLASLLVLPSDACGLTMTSAILSYLAGESAGQCGPCMFGLPAVAADFEALASGMETSEVFDRLRRRLGVIPGRGACAHPDGAVGLAASALEVFADDLTEHLRGRPCGRDRAATLPILKRLSDPEQGWR